MTKTIPIVFATHADPVGLGDVVSLSRPGGNITGLSMLLTELSVKELEILKEGDDISPVAFRTLGWRGRHLVVGFAADKIPALPVNIALLKGASLVGVDSAQIRKWDPDVHARLTNEIATWLETKAVEPPPTLAFPFERFLELSTQSVRGELPARSSLS